MFKTYNLDTNDNEYVQNMIMRDDVVTKMPGYNRYNDTALENVIRWCGRYYGRSEDKTLVKKCFVSVNDKIYMGTDQGGTFAEVHTGLSTKGNPESFTMQVAGQSRMYFFNGYDTPVYYEGADDGDWLASSITQRFVQGIEKDDRLWAFERRSSTVFYSARTNPEDFGTTNGGSFTVGNDKDSYIQRLVVIGNYLYIFKTNATYVLSGSTKATYDYDVALPEMGLLSQKGACLINQAIVFVCQQDKQIYEYTGGFNTKPLSGKTTNLDFVNKLDLTKTDTIDCVWDRRNNLYRISYKGMPADESFNNYEAVFPTDESGKDGKVKWSIGYGARVSCYSMWDEQGDNSLVSGHSNTGYVYYHNRGSDWDDIPIEIRIRTDDISPKKGHNCQFNSIFLRGKPSNGTITMRVYLNSRLTLGGTRSSQTIDDTGEETTLESITIKDQKKFNNWIPLLTGSNYGESISLEFYDNTAGKQIELEEVTIDYTRRSKVKNSLVG